MVQKQFSSVAEMTRSLADDVPLAEAFEKRIAERKIIRQLVALRSAQGLSQADIGTAMGCTQSRISKLESGLDRDLSLDDLESYLNALGLVARLVVSRNDHTISEAIKYHWTCLGQQLDKLLDLAANDAEIAVGIGKFSQDITFNYMLRIADFIKRLPADARQAAPVVDISVEQVTDQSGQPPEEHASRAASGRSTRKRGAKALQKQKGGSP